jgi:hypothetical protein
MNPPKVTLMVKATQGGKEIAMTFIVTPLKIPSLVCITTEAKEMLGIQLHSDQPARKKLRSTPPQFDEKKMKDEAQMCQFDSYSPFHVSRKKIQSRRISNPHQDRNSRVETRSENPKPGHVTQRIPNNDVPQRQTEHTNTRIPIWDPTLDTMTDEEEVRPKEIQRGQESQGRYVGLLKQYAHIFQEKLSRAGAARTEPVEIHVPRGKQIYVPPRQINQTIIEDLRAEIQSMRQAGVIEPSNSRHNTPLTAVRKSSGKLRICMDLRALNSVCEDFKWEFPRMDRLLRKMSAAMVFSKLDLTSGFWQIPLKESCRDLTTFRIDGNSYRFRVMPFGWKCAPAVFQAAMDTILDKGIKEGFLSVYMDDILIHSPSPAEHYKHLRWLFQTLASHGIKLNMPKCIIGKPHVEFLGHIISTEGIKPVPDKLDVIHRLAPASNISQVRSLLGTLGFYQNFIPRFAEIMKPISLLLRKGRPFVWGSEQDEALTKIKQSFKDVNPLHFLQPDSTKEFVIRTDASQIALGAQLRRIGEDNKESVIANISRALTPAETRYSNTERELLAMVWAQTRLEMLTAGFPINFETDHAALIPILSGSVKKVSTTRVERLRMKFQRWSGTTMTITHIPGKTNTADGLSRPAQMACEKKQAQPAAHRVQRKGTPSKPPHRTSPVTLDAQVEFDEGEYTSSDEEGYQESDDESEDEIPDDNTRRVTFAPNAERREYDPKESSGWIIPDERPDKTISILRLSEIRKAQQTDGESITLRQ